MKILNFGIRGLGPRLWDWNIEFRALGFGIEILQFWIWDWNLWILYIGIGNLGSGTGNGIGILRFGIEIEIFGIWIGDWDLDWKFNSFGIMLEIATSDYKRHGMEKICISFVNFFLRKTISWPYVISCWNFGMWFF